MIIGTTLTDVHAGDLCRLRFLVRIQDIWGWNGFPRYGFAIDDIALSGVQIVGEGNWTTIDPGQTDNSQTLGTRSAGDYAYRVRALVGGQWQAYSPAVVLTVMAGYDQWSQNLPAALRDGMADADSDGVINLLEYALGRDGNSAIGSDGRAQLPSGQVQNEQPARFTFTVDLPQSAPEEVTYGIYHATELSGPWTLLSTKKGRGDWTGAAAVNGTPGQQGREVWSLTEDVTKGNTRRFFQLKVSR
jgi:hypothetical protein